MLSLGANFADFVRIFKIELKVLLLVLGHSILVFSTPRTWDRSWEIAIVITGFSFHDKRIKFI